MPNENVEGVPINKQTIHKYVRRNSVGVYSLKPKRWYIKISRHKNLPGNMKVITFFYKGEFMKQMIFHKRNNKWFEVDRFDKIQIGVDLFE